MENKDYVEVTVTESVESGNNTARELRFSLSKESFAQSVSLPLMNALLARHEPHEVALILAETMRELLELGYLEQQGDEKLFAFSDAALAYTKEWHKK